MTFLDELVHISVKDFQMPNAVLVDFYYNHEEAQNITFDENLNQKTIDGYNAVGWRYKLKIPFNEEMLQQIDEMSQQISDISVNDLPTSIKTFIKEFLESKYIEISKEKGYNISSRVIIELPDKTKLE